MALLRFGARRLRPLVGRTPSHPSSFLSECPNPLAQPISGTRDVFAASLSQQKRNFAQLFSSSSLEIPGRRSIAISSSGWLRDTSPFFQSRGLCNTAKEAASERGLLPRRPRSLVLARQPIPRNLKIQRQCISTNIPPKNSKLDMLKQPLDGIKKTATQYKEAVGIQLEAFWKRNFLILIGAVGVLACLLLWRIMYGVANIFVTFSEGMAKFGFLAMAAATVAFTGMYLKARFTINPDKVYRIAMRHLNTSAAALEVLGPPLTGTDLRAYVMSSGGLRLKNFKPRLSKKRCFLIFPIQGSERRGLVSAEVKKKKGQYDFKLLAIDVANPGADQRVFLIGDEMEYKVGGGLISQLRDPILKAMAAQKEFEDQDEKEEEEEQKEEEARKERELKEEETRRNEEIERLKGAAAG